MNPCINLNPVSPAAFEAMLLAQDLGYTQAEMRVESVPILLTGAGGGVPSRTFTGNNDWFIWDTKDFLDAQALVVLSSFELRLESETLSLAMKSTVPFPANIPYLIFRAPFTIANDTLGTAFGTKFYRVIFTALPAPQKANPFTYNQLTVGRR